MDSSHGLQIVTRRVYISLHQQNYLLLANLGFQSQSTRHNREAPISESPSPPAFDDRRKRTMATRESRENSGKRLHAHRLRWEDLLKRLTYSCRLAVGVCLYNGQLFSS